MKLSQPSLQRYWCMTAAEFTERHDVTLAEFYEWVVAGRPTYAGWPVIKGSVRDYTFAKD